VPPAKSTDGTRASRSRASKKVSLLGDGFAVGVATAGYQIEGGYNGDGEPANNWSAWERSGRVERSGPACDFWAHPEEALDRAAAIGCNAFRLSVEWARLEPESGRFDDAALARYVEILEMCATRGLEPIVTLHHFTHPNWLGEEFWLRPGSPDRFARHVERVLPELAPHCRRWVTLNEPNIVMLKGWVEGAHPPGRRLAFAEVTCNTSSSSIYEQDRLLTDLLLLGSTGVPTSDIDRYIDERRALHDAAFPPESAGEFALRRFFAALSPYGTDRGAGGGPVWAQLHSTARRPVPRRVVDVALASPQVRSLGAVGFDWYDPVASHALHVPGRRRPPHNRRDWSIRQDLWAVPSRADALRSWCRTEAAFHGGLPLWVVENGMATRMRDHRHVPRSDGWDRPHFLRKHLGAVVGAVADGAPVTVYLHWSLVDNYEWGSYEPRFGIYGMDRSDPSGRVRWLDTDAAGDDAADTFSHVVRGLLAGDRSVLDG
jgi:beta-glucosidase